LYILLLVVIFLQQSAARMLGHADLTASLDSKRSTSPDALPDINLPFDLILLYSTLLIGTASLVFLIARSYILQLIRDLTCKTTL
jgi:hypothetical protein